MTTAGIRMPQVMLAELHRLAHQESLRLGKNISWASLAREVLRRELLAGRGDEDVNRLGHPA